MAKALEKELVIADETIGTLLDEIDDLRGVLAHFGGHVFPCQFDGGKCFCGWVEIIDEFDLNDVI